MLKDQGTRWRQAKPICQTMSIVQITDQKNMPTVHLFTHSPTHDLKIPNVYSTSGSNGVGGRKNGNPWCTDVSRSLTRFPSRSAHARERDAENPPWWGACVEIPSCRVRMRSNCLPAWQVNVLRTLLRLDSRLDRVLTRQQLTAEKEKRKTT